MINIQFNPMSHFPKVSRDDFRFSEMVLVFDKDLKDENFDLGYYDFEDDKWVVMGDFQMDLICWCYVSQPPKAVSIFKSYLTEL